jgi:hypothetical protein
MGEWKEGREGRPGGRGGGGRLVSEGGRLKERKDNHVLTRLDPHLSYYQYRTARRVSLASGRADRG